MITPKRKLGNKGEDIACDFLIKNGFRIIGRNISNKLGEIDIVARNNRILHFIEVKTGSASDKINPSENLNYHKIRKFLRAVEIYISNNKISEQQRWQMDAIVVVFNGGLPPKITHLQNINIQ